MKTKKKKKSSVRKEIAKNLLKSIWGSDFEKYNLVTSHMPGISFLIMQILRLVYVVGLFAICGFYVYIYLRQSLVQFTFWALFITFLAFAFLFIGSGKQKVY